MKTLRIFNPDNDLALASGKSNYTSPVSARTMASDLAMLPQIWAEEGDYVVASDSLKSLPKDIESVDPWGWNPMLLNSLRRAGVDEAVLPNDEEVVTMRTLSNRATAVSLLKALRKSVSSGICGESEIVTDEKDVQKYIQRHGTIVLKAPWSCSGKGVRFVDDYTENVSGWVKRIIGYQGSIEMEPAYDKVADFAMEFEANRDGTVSFLGLSCFTTSRGAYTGNIVASEEYKLSMLCEYVDEEIISVVRTNLIHLLQTIIHGIFVGVFGVDMMICRDEAGKMVVHPCVEVNFRKTMGYVSIMLRKFVPIGEHRRFYIDFDSDSSRLQARVSPLVEAGKARLLTPLHSAVHYVALLCDE